MPSVVIRVFQRRIINIAYNITLGPSLAALLLTEESTEQKLHNIIIIFKKLKSNTLFLTPLLITQLNVLLMKPC